MSLIIEKCTDFARDLELPIHADEYGVINKETLLGKTIEFLHSELKETEVALAKDAAAKLNSVASILSEVVDGFGDVAFIAINGIYKTFRTSGLNHIQAHTHTIEVLNRICDANNRKRQKDGSVIILDNKVQKPEGWTAPDHSNLFDPAVYEKVIDPNEKAA